MKVISVQLIGNFQSTYSRSGGMPLVVNLFDVIVRKKQILQMT